MHFPFEWNPASTKITVLSFHCWNCTVFKTLTWRTPESIPLKHEPSPRATRSPLLLSFQQTSMRKWQVSYQSFIKYTPLSNTWLSQVLSVSFVQLHIDFTEIVVLGFLVVQLRANFDQILSRTLSRIGPFLLDVGSKMNVLEHNSVGSESLFSH